MEILILKIAEVTSDFLSPSSTGGITVLGLGFVLGLRHAFDADHVVAVSTIVTRCKGLLGPSIVGLFWGIGHTFALLLMGGLMIWLQIEIPERMALALELVSE